MLTGMCTMGGGEADGKLVVPFSQGVKVQGISVSQLAPV